jgi:PAS domain S-box-containing protein
MAEDDRDSTGHLAPPAAIAVGRTTALSTLVHSLRAGFRRKRESVRPQERRASSFEEVLRDGEEKMRALLQSASEGIVLLDKAGRIELVNAKIEQMFGYERHELLGRGIDTFIPERSREIHAKHCEAYFLKPYVRAMGTAFSLTGRRKDGTEFPVDVSLSFVETETGILVMCFVSDITRRRQAEETLRAYSGRLEEMVEERTAALREAQAQIFIQERLQHDLELAQQVQAGLLPRQVPTLQGFEFAARALPARYVGGDLYDFIPSDPNACHIVLADIAGKGVPAALLTSTARALLRAETEHETSPANILVNVNASIYEELKQAEMFITVFFARLDARIGTLTYASAGHTETLWWRYADRSCRPLPGTGLPLGIVADVSLDAETLLLRPGDVIVFYSDGITEAANPRDQLFGLDRLVATLRENWDVSASDLSQAIVQAVETFRDGADRSDDLTLVVLKALPRTVSFTSPATLDHLGEVMALLRQVALAYGSDFAYEMELASSEIVTNVIRHACRLPCAEIRGQIALLHDRIQLDLYDSGEPFDPQLVPEPDLGEAHEGGYGLTIARQLADELDYTPGTPDGNHWRLVKTAGPN